MGNGAPTPVISRMLHPGLGRFVQRDPLGYVDGMSVYQYVRSRPFYFTDAQGAGATVNDRNRRARMRRQRRNGEESRQRIPGLGPRGPIEALQGLIGTLVSVPTGDAFDRDNPFTPPEPGQCVYIIAVNGIFGDYSEDILERLRGEYPGLIGAAGSAPRNNSHLGGVGDVIQIGGSELGLVGVAAQRVASHVARAHQALSEDDCCENFTIRLFAHSQGAALWRRAQSFLSDGIIDDVVAETWGPQQGDPNGRNLRNDRPGFLNSDVVPDLSPWNRGLGFENINNPGGRNAHDWNSYFDYSSQNPN